MNWRIDGAKTGAVNEYTNYPDVEKRVNKATGGPHGRMPAFFEFTRNGRRDKTTGRKKKRKWAKINQSTMNRICKAFDDIGNINMNLAGVPPFNWEMLLLEPCLGTRMDIVSEFCSLDDIKVSLAIRDAEESPAERELINNNTVMDEFIIETLTEKFKSLEACYPYIVKHLFTGEGAGKASHKQTFWRIFGDIAVSNIRKNLENCTTCEACKTKVPKWAQTHDCPKEAYGLYSCIDCGKLCERTNSRQQRCPECQEYHRHNGKILSRERTRKRKERERSFTSFLPYRSRKT